MKLILALLFIAGCGARVEYVDEFQARQTMLDMKQQSIEAYARQVSKISERNEAILNALEKHIKDKMTAVCTKKLGKGAEYNGSCLCLIVENEIQKNYAIKNCERQIYNY